jgi:hypothetical protein
VALGIIMRNLCKRGIAAFVIAAAFIVVAWTPARADVVVQIDKSAQRMSVNVDGVTTGRSRPDATAMARRAALSIRKR